MRRALLVVVLAFLVVTGAIAAGNYGFGPVVITHEGEQNLILSFLPPRAVVEPGWSLRFPIVEQAVPFDRRLLYLNIKPDVIQTIDQERLVVDNYVMWRIENPIDFQSAFPQGRGQAEKQIDRVVRAQVREVIGQKTLTQVLTDQRIEIMNLIRESATRSMVGYGVAIQDVRINRTELPSGVIGNVYARMQTNRERLARKYRAEGDEQARKIRADADAEARVIVAEARGNAQVARGEGDAESARIYADAYNEDPEFYAFLRSLEAYRKTIGEGTTVVLSPSSEFFRYFDDTGGSSR